jgi:hypothetical protein
MTTQCITRIAALLKEKIGLPDDSEFLLLFKIAEGLKRLAL